MLILGNMSEVYDSGETTTCSVVCLREKLQRHECSSCHSLATGSLSLLGERRTFSFETDTTLLYTSTCVMHDTVFLSHSIITINISKHNLHVHLLRFPCVFQSPTLTTWMSHTHSHKKENYHDTGTLFWVVSMMINQGRRSSDTTREEHTVSGQYCPMNCRLNEGKTSWEDVTSSSASRQLD